MANEIPENFLCPINQTIMKNPVICVGDSQTYEESAIRKWLQKSNISPSTGKELKDQNIIVNYAVKNMIQEWLAKNADVVMKDDAKDEKKDVAQVNQIPGITLRTFAEDRKFFVNISVDETKDRLNHTIVCVIDTSGSMGTETAHNGEHLGLSRLDLVKHSMKAIINTMSNGDYLGIVEFNEESSVILPITKMDPNGRATALENVENMSDRYCTQIWKGLDLGFKMLEKHLAEDTIKSVLLLTDGEPTDEPNYIIDEFQKYLEDRHVNFSLSVAGFAYNLNTSLLEKLATLGKGSYLFIPDVTMIGTIFVNYLANTFSLFSRNVKLTITETYNGSTQLLESFPTNISRLQYGQNHTFLYERKNQQSELKIFLTVNNQSIVRTIKNIDIVDAIPQNILAIQKDRMCLIKFLRDLKNDIPKKLNKVYEDLQLSEFKQDIFSHDPHQGQISKACDIKHHANWGIHYLPMVLSAHVLEQCVNFKDASIQLYKGPSVSRHIVNINRLYNTIPIKARKNAPAPRISCAASINDAGNGCFQGFVETLDGKFVETKDLKKGDKIITFRDGIKNFATILCVTKITAKNIVKIDDVLLTPYHPIFKEMEWMFPVNLSNIISQKEILYDFVLDRDHVIKIGKKAQIFVPTFGHGIQGPIIGHEYFGTQNVVKDLETMPGWNKGFVDLDNAVFIRNSQGLVCKIV